nr:RING finger protein 223-like [Pelodiscus sinensis]|eukprot:XP_006117440.1 RING finger protein 223-like [Pelodiscus sinensis]
MARRPNQPEPQPPECPVCYSPYNSVFQRPLLLPCAHTVCLECLARICLFVRPAQAFPCPLCRAPVPVPDGGVPKLPPNTDIVAQLPPWQQPLQEVWLDGHRLCWARRPPSPRPASVGEDAPETLVTVELLHNPAARDASGGGLIGTYQPPCLALCRGLCRLVWERRLAVLWGAVLLLALIVLPIVFIPGSRMARAPKGQRPAGALPTAAAPSSNLSSAQRF